ncbi:MAG: hypothetical protein GX153_10705, partial [Clostridiaceae bacterium]|nr:hypothetical protein [Clostridiaceae bacterium]
MSDYSSPLQSQPETRPHPEVRGYPIVTPESRPIERLAGLRERLIERHPSLRDLSRRIVAGDDPATQELVHRIAAWEASEVPVRAFEIPASRMDRLIQAFVVQTDPVLRDRIDVVLQARMKRRFCALVWQLLQDRYEDAALLSLLFSGAAGRRRFRAGESMRFLDFFRVEDRTSDIQLPTRVCHALNASGQSVRRFFRECEIPDSSGLAIAVLGLYFASAEAPVFKREADALVTLFGSLDQPAADEAEMARRVRVFPAPLARYLELFEPPDYDSRLLRLLVPQFGHPVASAPMWSELNDAQRLRFSQWLQLDRLQSALGESRHKIRILSTVYPYIENVIVDTETSLVFVYFGRFVMVDRPEESDVMLLYPRAVFTQTYDLFLRQRTAREEAIACTEQLRAEGLAATEENRQEEDGSSTEASASVEAAPVETA